MKLLSMTDYVLQEQKGGQQVNSITSQLHYELRSIKKYAKFLKQPLKLEMFFPCNEYGSILNEPLKNEFFENNFSNEFCNSSYELALEKYKKAKENVLFNGFELNFEITEIVGIINNDYQIWFYKNGTITINSKEIKTIEYLVKYNLTLTPNAIKHFFG